jgi:hypothetical protein
MVDQQLAFLIALGGECGDELENSGRAKLFVFAQFSFFPRCGDEA